MVDLVPVLVLPLVHHLMEERPQRFLPAFAAQVTATDGDFRGITCIDGSRVVSQTCAHPARDTNAKWVQRSTEVRGIERAMRVRKTRGEFFVVRMRGRASLTGGFKIYWKTEKDALRTVTLDAGTRFDELYDR